MILWEKLVEFLVSTIGQPIVDSWRSSNNVDSYFSDLREALPEARRLIERSECWRLPIYDPIDRLLYQLKDSVYEAESIVDELEYERLKNKVEKSFPGISKILTNWMRDFPTKVKVVHDRLKKVYNEMKVVCDRHGIPENPNQFSPTARPITSTFLEISNVWGRDKEFNEVIRLMGVPSYGSRKRKRVKIVSMHNSDIGESSSRTDKKGNMSVLSIVGMGGVGKTTLAQMVCNDKSVKSYFDLIMWVCVSDNFHLVRLTKEMIEWATRKECNLTDFNAMQLALVEILKSKKFLLVLDDVWSKDWQSVLAPMKKASKGSVVLVTTRSPECVEISGTSIASRGVINLEGLEEHIYWEFFKSCAFDSVADSNYINPELEVIGKEICKRLKGSLLAAKTIGDILRTNLNVKHWLHIKDSKMWELQKREHDILPVLQLSYQYLPTHLKKCFSFCSLYPKDFKFTQSELTEFWIMQGFIQPLDNDNELRTLANGYFVDLVRRGFFQTLAHGTGNEYVIHDLMHDVCLSITRDECFCLENGHSEEKVSLDIRHVSVFHKKLKLEEQKELCKYKKLLSLKVGPNSCRITGIETWCNVLKNIRSLSLARCKIKKLPENIGNLKHLQFLDISGTYVETLPESFCNLYNLQYLNMTGCSQIKCFPEGFNKLVNLQLFYLAFEMVSLVERFENIVKAIKLDHQKINKIRRRLKNNILRLPTGHMVDEVSIFGRDVEKMEIIDFLLSEKEKSFSVISIIGKGGIGKTTIAELVYKDLRDSRCFDLFGWVCVSKVFDVRRLIKATVESISKINYGVRALSLLQEELAETMKGKTILLVLDDVWNENQSLWELFRVSFMEARMVRILVTTRNKNVADVMQSTACFSPTNLPESSCWQLFEYYASSGTSDIVPTHLVYIGKEIMRKCGGLPLAVKLIASLLSHETDVEGWREILKSDIWESNPSNDIFPALQISYARLPDHLKPCFLFCSLYPKDYLLEKMKLIELWISHGYIKSKGKRRITEIGGEYYEELKERSILDDFSSQSSECCKLHDIIHDLARHNSENEHYTVEINQPLDIHKGNVPREVYHLYARGFLGYVNEMLQQNQQNLIGLKTLSMDLRGCSSELEHQYCIKNTEALDLNLKQSENYEECYGEVAICNVIEFRALTVLELKGYNLTKIPNSIYKLRHLAYLCITSSRLKKLPFTIGFLYNLQTLILDCFYLEYLPESIGNLANLQFLYIKSGRVKKLPKSLCSLSSLLRLVIRSDDLEEIPLDIKNLCNLHALTIRSNRIQALPNTIGCLSILEELNLLSLGVSYDDLPDGKLNYVPHGFVNFPAIKTMAAWLGVRTINWLKDMKDLEGKLSIGGLKNMSNLEDAQHANLINKCKIETLDLCWDPGYYMWPYDVKSELRLSLIPEDCMGGLVCADDVVSFSLLECLQPHPNLKKLSVRWYPSATVPNWMSDRSSFWSIQELLLECCVNIQSLPFENLHTLKHLTIVACSSIQVLQLEQVSSQLEKLLIVSCDNLELITGLGDLHMLAALEIYSCQALISLTMGGMQLALSTETFGDSSHEKPHTGQQSIASLRRLEIENCYLLNDLPDGLIPPGPCYVCVRGCGCPDMEKNLTSARNEISCSNNLWRWR
ncbi:uncharacterized protein LOC144546291 isoform X2 [Carex rostrata]